MPRALLDALLSAKIKNITGNQPQTPFRSCLVWNNKVKYFNTEGDYYPGDPFDRSEMANTENAFLMVIKYGRLHIEFYVSSCYYAKVTQSASAPFRPQQSCDVEIKFDRDKCNIPKQLTIPKSMTGAFEVNVEKMPDNTLSLTQVGAPRYFPPCLVPFPLKATGYVVTVCIRAPKNKRHWQDRADRLAYCSTEVIPGGILPELLQETLSKFGKPNKTEPRLPIELWKMFMADGTFKAMWRDLNRNMFPEADSELEPTGDTKDIKRTMSLRTLKVRIEHSVKELQAQSMAVEEHLARQLLENEGLPVRGLSISDGFDNFGLIIDPKTHAEATYDIIANAFGTKHPAVVGTLKDLESSFGIMWPWMFLTRCKDKHSDLYDRIKAVFSRSTPLMNPALAGCAFNFVWKPSESWGTVVYDLMNLANGGTGPRYDHRPLKLDPRDHHIVKYFRDPFKARMAVLMMQLGERFDIKVQSGPNEGKFVDAMCYPALFLEAQLPDLSWAQPDDVALSNVQSLSGERYHVLCDGRLVKAYSNEPETGGFQVVTSEAGPRQALAAAGCGWRTYSPDDNELIVLLDTSRDFELNLVGSEIHYFLTACHFLNGAGSECMIYFTDDGGSAASPRKKRIKLAGAAGSQEGANSPRENGATNALVDG